MWMGVGRGGRSDSSCSEEDFGGREAAHGADQYEPIKRLALLRLQPPRNPNKPPTPFLIRDILNGRVGKRRRQYGPVGAPTRDVIVRPWLETPRSPCSRGGSAGSVSDDVDDEYDEDDEEIEVEEKKPPANQSVSPLDALLQMATKTFDGLKSHETQPNDAARTDQLNMFAKTVPSKKRRKSRTAFTNQQIYELEKRFLYQKYLTPTDRDEIALSLGLTNAQVITWFQNRRAKLKRDLEELKADVTAAKKTSECGSEIDEEMPYVPVSTSPDELRSRKSGDVDALKALSSKTLPPMSLRIETTASPPNS